MENETQLQDFYLPSVTKMRLFLMMGAILYTFGSIAGLQDLNGVIFGFTFPSLFIISGYVVLWESDDTEKRILRTIRRTAICFVILGICYFGLSLVLEPSYTLATISTKKFWFDFILLNVWSLPIGSTIWFVQSLLYAYIIIYVIYKLKLLRFDILFVVLCLAVTLLTGELASVVGFNFFGHNCIGGNFLTRALPYILIGCFIRRKEAQFNLINYIGILVTGIILIIGEYFALSLTGNKLYIGHLFGMGIVAVAVCMFIFFASVAQIQLPIFENLSRYEMMIPFFVCSPIYYITTVLIQLNQEIFERLYNFMGIITLILSVGVLFLYALIRFAVYSIIHRKERGFDI